MVFAILRLYPSPKERGHLLEILRSVQNRTIVRPGCLGCWLYEEDPLHNHVRYGEQWSSEEDLYDHIRSDLYRRILEAMELSSLTPDAQFHYVSETKGLELIEAIRTRRESPSTLD